MKKILTWICIINLFWITGCSGKDVTMEEENDTGVNDVAASEASFTQNEEETVVDDAEPEEADDRESDVEALDAEKQEAKSERLDTEESTEMSVEVMEQLQFWLDTYRPPLPGTEAEILQLNGLALRMEDSAYPELREWLQQYREQAKDYAHQVIMYRADVRALSFLETREDGSVYRGYQFDPEMGQEIALADSVHDVDRLSLIIESQLRINYPNIDFAEDMAERLKQIWQDEEAAWTISYHGICFYIPSEMLAAKKGILLHAAVAFQDVPDLFAERYIQIPEAYTIELEDDIPLLYDIDMDGSIDRIQVFHYLRSEEKDTEIQINDERCAGYYDDEYYDEDFRWTYLLHTAENRNYIVFWAKGDLDGSGCYGVYAVEDGEIEYRGCEEKNIDLGTVRITDPAYVRITHSSAPILTLFNFNEAVYYIDESGFWQIDNEIFYYKDSIAEIKANIELEMPLVDPYTGEMLGMEITLPKGTYMELLRTDLWTWCDFVMEDGSVCRMEFDEPFGSSNWIVEYKGVEVEGGCLSIYPSQIKENREAGQ